MNNTTKHIPAQIDDELYYLYRHKFWVEDLFGPDAAKKAQERIHEYMKGKKSLGAKDNLDMKDQWDKMIDGMFNTDVQALCHLLLLKRSVDGMNGRTWNAKKHLDCEVAIAETLEQQGTTS